MKAILSPRWSSPILLSVFLACLYWLRPDLSPEMFGVTSPIGSVWMMFVIFFVCMLYLASQGFDIAYGDIGSPGVYNIDNIISFFPVVVTAIGFVLAFFGFRPLSSLALTITAMAFITALFDLVILGGAAAKINYLTDELKSQK